MRDIVRALVVLVALPGAGVLAAELPTGFGTISLGMPFSEIERIGGYTELTRPTSEWERHVYECGYRSAQMTLDKGRLLVTAQDFLITELSYVTSIQAGSDVMKVAELVIKSYGQPKRATLRDSLGAITIDQSRAAYVVLEYAGSLDVEFVVSGDPMWEYRISIEDRNARRLENRTMRCARELEKNVPPPAPKTP